MLMRNFALALILGLAACAPSEPPLNSERIAQVFGSYGVELLLGEESLRVSALESTHDGVDVTRTLAIVRFAPTIGEALAEPHAAIQNGASIGATLTAAGWAVEKHNLYFGELPAPRAVAARMAVPTGTALALHAYALTARQGALRIDYATIAEIHHPDYLDREALTAIYGAAAARDAGAAEAFRGFVDRALERLATAGSADSE